jgi:hypothetical protein
MMEKEVDIRHLSYRVETKARPNERDVEFVLVNLVFQVNEPTYKDIFLRRTEDYKKVSVITDVEEYEKILHDSSWLEDSFNKEPDEDGLVTIDIPDTSHLHTEGYQYQSSMLRYLPKFDVFQLTEYFSWTSAVQGILQDLRLLQRGVNLTRTTDSCYLDSLTSALEYFWD